MLCYINYIECLELEEFVNGRKFCWKVVGENFCIMVCDKGFFFEVEVVIIYICGFVIEWIWNGMMDMIIFICLSEY